VEDKKMSRREYKDAMRVMFTIRRSVVKECCHKINEERQPNNNCKFCWFSWLNSHGELIQTADEMWHKPGGQIALVNIQGRKFVKMWLKFMSTVARLKAEQEKNGEGTIQPTDRQS
jgi:hypothetical protein